MNNWAGNIEFSTETVHRPTTMDELQRIVRDAERIKVIGTRHSFNRIADSTHAQLSLDELPDRFEIDRDKLTVTVSGHLPYGIIAERLHAAGYALHNMGSLPHISVIGAIATATHGSGDSNGNLATAVVGLEMVTADGELKSFSRAHNGDAFDGMVVGLGALGIVTTVTLNIEPTYQMTQTIYENLPFSRLESDLDGVFGAGYSMCLFTRWQENQIYRVFAKRRVPSKGAAEQPQHLYESSARETALEGEKYTPQLGLPGPWHERLPHFRMGFTPSVGEELQSEFFVPREFGYEAIMAVNSLAHQIEPLLFATELRSIAADSLWMSPCYERNSVAIHFTWKPNWPAVKALLPKIDAVLQKFDVRPHWGKLFVNNSLDMPSRYPKFADFKQLVETYDPNGKFRNRFLNEYLV